MRGFAVMPRNPLDDLLTTIEARLAAAQDDVAQRNALERVLDGAEDVLQYDYVDRARDGGEAGPNAEVRSAAYCEVRGKLRSVREHAGIPPSLEPGVPDASRPAFHAEVARLVAVVERTLSEPAAQVPSSFTSTRPVATHAKS